MIASIITLIVTPNIGSYHMIASIITLIVTPNIGTIT